VSEQNQSNGENQPEVRSVAKIKSHNGGSEQDPGASHASSGSARPTFKIKLALKLVAFIFSVITLSWFFEGTRQIQNGLSLSAVAYVLAGSVLTVALIGVQAFFIYAEEKSKNDGTRKIPLFDKIYYKLAGVNKGDGKKPSDLEGKN